MHYVCAQITRAERWTGQVWDRGTEETISAVPTTYSSTNVQQHTVSVLIDVVCSQMLVFCSNDIGVQHRGIKASHEQLFHPGVDHLVRAATAFEWPSARRWLQVKINLLQKHNFILAAFTIPEHSEVFVGQLVHRAKMQPEVVTETEDRTRRYLKSS